MTDYRLLTIRLEPETHHKLKVRAAEEQRSMQQIAAQAIHEIVGEKREATAEK